MADDTNVQFTTLLRKTTKQIHDFSDSLVQSKFVIGLIDDRVWAEGLLVFYEIFLFLESRIEKLSDTYIGRFNNPALMRATLFEADLELYYGKNWKITHTPKSRECVRNYINHLEELEKTEPNLLIPYIYHLYLGLLSGGIIIRKKHKLTPFSVFSKQSSVVDFESKIVGELKTFIKNITNDIAENLDEDMKKKLLDESITVFKLNCDLIRSVESAKNVYNKIVKIISYLGLLIMFIILFYFYFKQSNDEKDL